MNTTQIAKLGLFLAILFIGSACKEKTVTDVSKSFHTANTLEDVTFRAQIFVNIPNPKVSKALELQNTIFEYIWIRNLQVGNRVVPGIPYCWNGELNNNAWDRPLRISKSADEILASIGGTKMNLESREHLAQIQDIWYYIVISSEFLNHKYLCVEDVYWRRALEANVASVLLMLNESELGGDELWVVVKERFDPAVWMSVADLAAEISKGEDTDLFKLLYNDKKTFLTYGKPIGSSGIGLVELKEAYSDLAIRMK
ncbi:hypothetical protein JIN77_10665 [Verrucomicrobiaceae bacterium R5-34]|nr:hypothetical protein [Verrucomicrobiaceae bacterium R5-34]